jgi:uracil-DNA glycosylase family 4
MLSWYGTGWSTTRESLYTPIDNLRQPRNPEVMDEEFDTLADIRNYLEYQVNVGFRELVIPRVQRSRAPSLAAPATLDNIRQELGECTRCPLHHTRRSIVFGEGNPRARLMFVGEGPGADEDKEGRPFVGRAGRLLNKMIQAMGLDRADVYIANVVKCRPPGNRDPEALEIETCLSFLEAQISAIKPEVIVTLGRIAAHTLLGSKESLTKLRGRFHQRNGIPIMPTYHPSFLLRQEKERRYKAEAWADLKQVMAMLNLPISPLEKSHE